MRRAVPVGDVHSAKATQSSECSRMFLLREYGSEIQTLEHRFAPAEQHQRGHYVQFIDQTALQILANCRDVTADLPAASRACSSAARIPSVTKWNVPRPITIGSRAWCVRINVATQTRSIFWRFYRFSHAALLRSPGRARTASVHPWRATTESTDRAVDAPDYS